MYRSFSSGYKPTNPSKYLDSNLCVSPARSSRLATPYKLVPAVNTSRKARAPRVVYPPEKGERKERREERREREEREREREGEESEITEKLAYKVKNLQFFVNFFAIFFHKTTKFSSTYLQTHHQWPSEWGLQVPRRVAEKLVYMVKKIGNSMVARTSEIMFAPQHFLN